MNSVLVSMLGPDGSSGVASAAAGFGSGIGEEDEEDEDIFGIAREEDLRDEEEEDDDEEHGGGHVAQRRDRARRAGGDAALSGGPASRHAGVGDGAGAGGQGSGHGPDQGHGALVAGKGRGAGAARRGAAGSAPARRTTAEGVRRLLADALLRDEGVAPLIGAPGDQDNVLPEDIEALQLLRRSFLDRALGLLLAERVWDAAFPRGAALVTLPRPSLVPSHIPGQASIGAGGFEKDEPVTRDAGWDGPGGRAWARAIAEEAARSAAAPVLTADTNGCLSADPALEAARRGGPTGLALLRAGDSERESVSRSLKVLGAGAWAGLLRGAARAQTSAAAHGATAGSSGAADADADADADAESKSPSRAPTAPFVSAHLAASGLHPGLSDAPTLLDALRHAASTETLGAEGTATSLQGTGHPASAEELESDAEWQGTLASVFGSGSAYGRPEAATLRPAFVVSLTDEDASRAAGHAEAAANPSSLSSTLQTPG
ncbi:hypothetical protein FNF28_07257 [Cafeteria roenbergensis]|uniref:Uncharacterized protein n=1 Tax=Cafeteria roenbergensis TaxID=33653 RepID=A0A5A8CBL7_CAFRO|nr:hypothetical protein FNF28_07257 [Cafeteria roenbergensis]